MLANLLLLSLVVIAAGILVVVLGPPGSGRDLVLVPRVDLQPDLAARRAPGHVVATPAPPAPAPVHAVATPAPVHVVAAVAAPPAPVIATPPPVVAGGVIAAPAPPRLPAAGARSAAVPRTRLARGTGVPQVQFATEPVPTVQQVLAPPPARRAAPPPLPRRR